MESFDGRALYGVTKCQRYWFRFDSLPTGTDPELGFIPPNSRYL